LVGGCRITGENRHYHHLSQFEIDGGKRISQHLSALTPAAWALASPQLNRGDGKLRKIALITSIKLDLVEAVLGAAKDYTVTVERALFKKAEETSPWRFVIPN
jgi:hypothetical protein